MKNFTNIIIAFFFINNLSASNLPDMPDMPDEAYRALYHGINDNIEDKVKILRIALEDSMDSLEKHVSEVDIEEGDRIKKTLATIKKEVLLFKKLEDQFSYLREIRVIEELGISALKGDERDRDFCKKLVSNFLNSLLELVNSKITTDYDARTSDFEEHYKQHDTYHRILVEIHREKQLYFAGSIRSIHALLGNEIDTLFDQLISAKLVGSLHDKYVKLYLRILKGYTTRKTDCMPEFGLFTLGRLDQNTFKNKCQSLQQCLELKKGIVQIGKKNRDKLKAEQEELKEATTQMQNFEVQERPILEKHYLEALKILKEMNKLSAEEKQTLDSLRQKHPTQEASVKKKRIRRKKKTEATSGPSKPDNSDHSDKEEDGLLDVVVQQPDLEMYPEAAQAMELQVLHAEDHRPKALPVEKPDESDDEEIVRMDSETRQELEQLQELYERDRTAKKPFPTKPAVMQPDKGDDDEESEEPVIHAQTTKLIEAFWHAEVMPWDDFEKFMTSKRIMNSKMETFGGSHRKFHFIRADDSKVSLHSFNPHKFGSSNVGRGQLDDAREFLKTQLGIAAPPK